MTPSISGAAHIPDVVNGIYERTDSKVQAERFVADIIREHSPFE